MFDFLKAIFGSSKSDKQNTEKQDEDIKVSVHGNGLFVVDLESLVNDRKIQKQVAYIEKNS